MIHHVVSRILFGIMTASLLGTALPAYGVQIFKTSDFQESHQIWFEAEDFDERTPEGDDHFVLVESEDAFGTDELNAINRNGQPGGRISYTFDISSAGGEGGEWYFWGRVINPDNTSDFLLVEGHPGDEIPTAPPFSGNFENGQRAFEQSQGPPWTWGVNPPKEGHIKQLQDGENTMHIVHRQGAASIFWDVFMWTDNPDYVPTDEDYENASIPIDNPGDFNGDGNIDLADFAILTENYNNRFPFAEAITKGDVTGDTNVDMKDFVAFRSLFLAGQEAGQAAAAVPEPGSLLLLVLGAGGLLARRRRG